MSLEGGLCVCFPFGGVVAGGVSSTQIRYCVSYMRENELVLVLVCFLLGFFLVLEILVHCVKFEGFVAL